MPVLVAVAVFALGCALRLPVSLQHQAQEEARHARLNEQQATTTAQLVELAQLRQSLVVAEQGLQEARWHLAAGEGMSDLLDRLAASGHVHGLHVERLEVHEEKPLAGYRKMPLEVQVVGRYPALRLWLDDWLGQARVLRTGDMHLAEADGQPGLLRLRLRIDAFHAPAPVPAPAALALIPARAASVPPRLDPFASRVARLAGTGLASVPLAQLEMVGSLSRGDAHEALLMAAGKLYRVRPGDRVGRDEGVVARVDQRQVEVHERLFTAGAWQERTAFITFAKRLGKEAPDQDERTHEMGGGGPIVDSAGNGSALSG